MSIIAKKPKILHHPKNLQRSALRTKFSKRIETPVKDPKIKSVRNYSTQQIQKERIRILEREEQTRNMIIKAEENRVYNVYSNYIKTRGIIIRSIEELSINLRLHQKTYYLAIALIDKLLSVYNGDQYGIPLICVVVVNIATKYNEKSTKKLSITQIMKLHNGKYSEEIIRACEFDILTKLQFRISFVTLYDLVQELIIVNRSAKQNSDVNNEFRRNTWLKKEAAIMFVEISINDYRFQLIPILIVALSCIISAMQLLGSQSFIGLDLNYLLLNNETEIDACVKVMFEYANKVLKSSKNQNKNINFQHLRKPDWAFFSQLYALENRKRLSKYFGSTFELRSRWYGITENVYKTYKDSVKYTTHE